MRRNLKKNQKLDFYAIFDLADFLHLGYLKITNNSFWKYVGLVIMVLLRRLDGSIQAVAGHFHFAGYLNQGASQYPSPGTGI